MVVTILTSLGHCQAERSIEQDNSRAELKCPSKIHIHLESQNMILYGTRVLSGLPSEDETFQSGAGPVQKTDVLGKRGVSRKWPFIIFGNHKHEAAP